jgi:hypothetical protein
MTADASSREAVTRALSEPRSAPDAPPPSPPRELDGRTGICLPFDYEGEAWIARAAGKGAGGTGSYGLAMMEAVHFCRAAEPVTPLYEALVAAGTLTGLFEDELQLLLSRAHRIVTPDEIPPMDARRGRSLRER